MEYVVSELIEAKVSLISLIQKSEKALPKLKVGSGAHTYLLRRIKAFHLSLALIEDKLIQIDAH